MLNELRTISFDLDINIEAYQFKGIMQKFPSHFHEYYVIGFIEEGKGLTEIFGSLFIFVKKIIPQPSQSSVYM